MDVNENYKQKEHTYRAMISLTLSTINESGDGNLFVVGTLWRGTRITEVTLQWKKENKIETEEIYGWEKREKINQRLIHMNRVFPRNPKKAS